LCFEDERKPYGVWNMMTVRKWCQNYHFGVN